ncbi:MAG: hypothetical protein JSR97_04895, partial [Verrucomicrobia bacterium]|nr:hypothetical protein [Verrucomicrobiota bacterium]
MDSVFWVATDLRHPDKINLPYDKNLIKASTMYKDSWQAWLSGKSYYNKKYNKQQKDKYFKYVFSNNDLKTIPQVARDLILKAKDHYGSLIVEKNAAIFFDSWNGFTYDEQSIAVFQRAAKVFEQAYIRFLDLQKAEAQAREAQIEAALERVRSRSMAMHKSEELKEVIRVVLEQFVHLNIKAEHAGFYIDYKVHDDMHIWLADPNIEPFFAILPYFDTPTWNSFSDAKAKGKILHTDLLNFKEKNNFYKCLFKLFVVPEEAKKFYMECKGLAVSTVLLDTIGLYIENFSAIPYTDEENQILIRFGKVFQQTYTRFLDLQKAEVQAREAQIEAALERVRARTMAMHRSDELLPTSDILFDQLRQLGAELQGVAFAICDKNSHIVQKWTSIGIFSHPYNIDPGEERMYEAWQKGEGYYEEVYEGDKQQRYYKAFMKIPEFKQGIQKFIDAGYPIPAWQKNHAITFKYGYLLVITTQPFDETQIFIRFGKVFEQTYTRFLDLQKAEAQAREAQIEASLERVRSRAMAMQKSDELNALIGTVFTELTKLDVSLTRCAILIYDDQEKGLHQWMVNAETPSEPMSFYIAYADLPYLNALIKAWKKRLLKWEYILEGEDKYSTDEFLFKKTELASLPGLVIAGMRAPEKVHISASFNNFGCVALASLERLSSEHFDILLRFAKVFDLTYTRFNDLQMAEAQAREAKIETSLEKVRVVALAMKKSNEMLDIAQVLYEQLFELGFSNIRNAIIDIHNSSNETFMDYDYSPEMGRTATLMSYYDHPFIEKQVRQTEMNNDAFFELVLEGKDLQDLIDIRLKNGEEEDPRLRKIEQLTYNLYSFGNGSIGISNFGLLKDDHKSVLKRFRNVFAFA